MEDLASEQRWPELSRLCAERDDPPQLVRLLNDAGWIYTPTFLDHAERALGVVRDTQGPARAALEQSVNHVVAQRKLRGCLDALVELAAGAWLAAHGVLDNDGRPAQSPVDFKLSVGGMELGLEVKSDFDAFESELMAGTSPDDEKALRRSIKARFGEDVRCLFTWLGRRPSGEHWGPIRDHVREEFRAAIAASPELPEQGLTFRGRLHEPEGGCYGAEIKVARHPLVNVATEIAGTGWESLADRISGHARKKCGSCPNVLLLLYVSLKWQRGIINPARLSRVRQHLAENPRMVPARFGGLLHLELGSVPDPPTARGFATSSGGIPWRDLEASLNLLPLPPIGGGRLRGRLRLG